MFRKDSTTEDALKYIKRGANQKELWKRFSADLQMEDLPFTYFMAGAPGSGKTEIVKTYLSEVFSNCVIADADEIRMMIPQYDGRNAYKIQKAASKGVDILYDKALKYNYSIIIDGTFALNYEKCRTNIKRSLDRKRQVIMFYLYSNPRVAWEYSKIREYKTGRRIKMGVFIDCFFQCRENIDRIKEEFGEKVYLVGMKSNYKKGFADIRLNMRAVDEIQEIRYTRWSLLLRLVYSNVLLSKEKFLWNAKKIKSELKIENE